MTRALYSEHFCLLFMACSIVLASLHVMAAAPADILKPVDSASTDFKQVEPGRQFTFPADHAPHPGYRIEWWYLTANMRDTEGRPWGIQWTLFRSALAATANQNNWQSPLVWMGHVAVSPPPDLELNAGIQGHQFEQRFARGGIGQAGVSSADEIVELGFRAWLDDWLWQAEQAASLLPASLTFSVGSSSLAFRLQRSGPEVLQGDSGYSRKSGAGQASFYYSIPFIDISGTLTSAAGNSWNLEGMAWLDREWSSAFLADDQDGWDWFALHLADGRKLMVYRLRRDKGQHHLSGKLIAADGSSHKLAAADIDLQAVSESRLADGTRVPLEWTLSLPTHGLAWRIKADYPEQLMKTTVPYWEGRVSAKPTASSPAALGYMELTGY